MSQDLRVADEWGISPVADGVPILTEARRVYARSRIQLAPPIAIQFHITVPDGHQATGSCCFAASLYLASLTR